MKVCYVISYRAPDYIRSKVLIGALEQMPSVDLVVVKNRSKGFKRYIESLSQFIRVRFSQNPDIYVLGFRAHEIFPIVRILTLGKPIIFDQMMSPFDSLKSEKKEGFMGKMLAPIIYLFEYIILHLSNIVLSDTDLHRQFFIEKYKLSPKKVKSVFVGSEEIRTNRKLQIEPEKNYLSVFFYGNFWPLHGIEHILEAAKELKIHPIDFVIVGGIERDLEEYQRKIKELELSNVKHIPWLEKEELFEEAMKADICLGGPFGGTPQARRIITGKTYQFLSLGAPTVVGKIELEVGFKDKENCILVEQADPKALTEAILWCLNNKDRLTDIGANGKKLFDEKFGVNAAEANLKNILDEFSS